ncbi:6-carboxytetrahydropterin synthase QueD [Micromonospora schwarzwaldensis]|uniref:6-carboxytetrahydropterin synthase QueD n=1 Tax=Micromonospora sp. DSM 45708 TaxID=3111767 RepID=UPI0031CF8CDE
MTPAPPDFPAPTARGPGIHRITKSFKFEAAHLLGGLPEGHQCARLHGHGYTVEITLAGRQLTGPGFVVDFAELQPLKRHLNDNFDHQFLNEILGVEPTSENLARVLFEWCASHLSLPESADIEAVRVHETTTSWAEYRVDLS